MAETIVGLIMIFVLIYCGIDVIFGKPWREDEEPL